jgi:glutathionylspermidine synthase
MATLIETSGDYGDTGYVYQQFARLPSFDGYYPNIGAWVIGDSCRGMGVREDATLVMANSSRFVPHFFR